MPTLVCVPITVSHEPADDARTRSDMREARDGGADLIELRIDSAFDGGTGDDVRDAALVRRVRGLIEDSPLPVVLTCRLASEGGDYDGDEVDRISLFEKLTAASATPPAYLDVEWASFSRSANIAQKVRLCVRHPQQQRPVTTGLVLSAHDFGGRPKDLMRRAAAMSEAASEGVVKVAFRARSLRDALDALELPAQLGRPTIALAMGEFGLASRVLAGKFDAFLTFAALRTSSATAPGQPTLRELLELYRFRAVAEHTRVYGIVGWPVAHSMSPLVHNAGFEGVGHDGVYLPLPIAGDGEMPEESYLSFKATLLELIEHERLGVAGVSVTMPHKENLLRLAHERGWGIDPVAAAVGSANTLVRVEGAARSDAAGWRILNTDAPAARAWMEQAIGGSLAGKRVGVLGAGGVARAVAHAAASAGATVVVYARDVSKAQRLCDALSGSMRAGGVTQGMLVAAAWELLSRSCCEVIVNCTPLGMAGGPGEGKSAVAEGLPRGCDTPPMVFDTVYSPLATPTLEVAARAGAKVVDGAGMFVEQAALQFEAWTAAAGPRGLFEKLVRERLGACAG
jgi:3-dehydroquinate dehydratase/shikimate dehydrogenase